VHAQFVLENQPGCDKVKAQKCEQDLLECRLFSGPADDPATMCRCGENFYGECLRLAGCETHQEVGPLRQLYMKKCVNHIYQYDCNPPDPLMCAVNCASNGTINTDESMIMIFNNYGEYYLRIRICTSVVHPGKLDVYSFVDSPVCNNNNDNVDDDFLVCGRWIPPQTFTPVAVPKATTYIEIDDCEVSPNGEQHCFTDRVPVRIYGNEQLFPTTYEVPKSDVSVCQADAVKTGYVTPQDDACLGSFCENKLRPSTCAPKLKRHYQQSGRNYFEVD
jgi:hypothetical protein